MKVIFKKNTEYGLKGIERDLEKDVLDKFAPGVFEIVWKKEEVIEKEAKNIENKAILEPKITKKIKQFLSLK